MKCQSGTKSGEPNVYCIAEATHVVLTDRDLLGAPMQSPPMCAEDARALAESLIRLDIATRVYYVPLEMLDELTGVAE